MRNKILSIVSTFLLFISTGLGFASWTFTNSESSNNNVTIAVKEFIFEAAWTDSDKLPEDAYQSAKEFEYAINNPNTPEGKAWKDAWNLKHNGSGGNQYVGSMGNRGADEDFAIIFTEDANFIAVRHDANSYSLYETNVNLNRYSVLDVGTWIQPVYRTLYTKQADGTYAPSQSWVGRCPLNIYYVGQPTTVSFDTSRFTQI